MSNSTRSLIAASVAFSVGLGGTAAAQNIGLDNLYVGMGAGYDYSNYDSGGFNTVGFFPNTDDDSDGSAFGSFFAGFDDIVGVGPVSLRAEIEGMVVGKKDIVTDSFAPPTPTFFYQTEVRTYAGLLNLWADFSPSSDIPVILSVGGGVGVAHHEIETNDTVVAGDDDDTTLAWTAGAQVAYVFSPTVSVGVMGRYADFGEPSIDLNQIGSTASAGDYTLDHSGAQVMAFLRFHFGAE